jgi:hypothetical protein
MRAPRGVHPHRHLGPCLAGQRDQPIDPRGLAARIALRDLAHADQRVMPAAQHQLLQVHSRGHVPFPHRLEDPASQPPYLLLAAPPVHTLPGVAVESRDTGRGFSGPFTEVSNLSFGSGICFRFASKAHLPTSASFRTRAPARYPASYTKTIREEFPILRPLTSCCLSAAGIRFLSTLSCQGIQPPLRSAYRTACAYPRLRCGPMARFPRSARVRPRPGRALSVPRGQRCSPVTLHPRPPPAASQRLVPATPAEQPSPECELDEASARVSW